MEVHPGTGLAISERAMISELRATIESLVAQLARLEHTVDEATVRADLEVRLLGSFEVRFGGETIHGWGARRPRLMFQYLAAHHPRPVHRDELIEALWPGAAPDPARRNLHQAAHAVRQIFRVAGAPDPVSLDGACYRLNLDVVTDAVEYQDLARRALREDPLRSADQMFQAIALYRGDLLETEPYEEWAEALRRHLRRTHLDLLDQHGRWLLDHGTFAETVAACRTTLRMEPTNESAYRRLMVAFARDGRHADAVGVYGQCREELEELGLSPSPPTEQLYDQILGGETV